eukprot:scaffold27480_cov240-Skeletonema_menzelii.AAC.1
MQGSRTEKKQGHERVERQCRASVEFYVRSFYRTLEAPLQFINKYIIDIMSKIICMLPFFLLRAVHAASLRRSIVEERRGLSLSSEQSLGSSFSSATFKSMSNNDKIAMMGFGDCSSKSKCDICEGSCAKDSDCKDNLVCKKMDLCEHYFACHYEEEHQSIPWCTDGGAIKSEWTSRLSRSFCVESDEASTLNATMDEENESYETVTDTTQDPDFKLLEEQATASSPTIETETSLDEDSEEKSGEQTLQVVEPEGKHASFSPTRQPTSAATTETIVTNLNKLNDGREGSSGGSNAATITMTTVGVVAAICVIALFVSKYKSKRKGRSKKKTLPISNSNAQIFVTTLGDDGDSTSSVDSKIIKEYANVSGKNVQDTASSFESDCEKSTNRSQQIVKNMQAQEQEEKTQYAESDIGMTSDVSSKKNVALTDEESLNNLASLTGFETVLMRDVKVRNAAYYSTATWISCSNNLTSTLLFHAQASNLVLVIAGKLAAISDK